MDWDRRMTMGTYIVQCLLAHLRCSTVKADVSCQIPFVTPDEMLTDLTDVLVTLKSNNDTQVNICLVYMQR